MGCDANETENTYVRYYMQEGFLTRLPLILSSTFPPVFAAHMICNCHRLAVAPFPTHSSSSSHTYHIWSISHASHQMNQKSHEYITNDDFCAINRWPALECNSQCRL